MNTRQLALAAALVPFLALTCYVLATSGWVGFFEALVRTPATALAGVDLALSLGLILVWMARDARETGTPLVPYVAVTLGFGVAGPLLYLFHREARGARAVARPLGESR